MKTRQTIILLFTCLMLISVVLLAPRPAQAGALTDYLENKLLDHLFRGQTYAAPGTLYVGLDTVSCTEAGGGTEVSGGSYARASVPATLAAWAGSQGAGTTTASSGSTGTTSNNAAIVFPAPTANWGQIVSFRLWDAASAGNALLCQALTVPKTVNNGDAAPQFNAGSLTVQIDS